jgi:putative peptidoglycan lipid II flippase
MAGLVRKVASVGGFTLASRVLGFLRDVLTAQYLGAGPIADAFFVAFRLPNHFRALFAEGAFNAAFVPMFSGVLVQDGREAARRFAEQILAFLLAAQLALLVLFLLIMPWFMYVFAPGFADEPAKFELAVVFTRITFPYLLFITLVALMGAVLNSLDRFTAAAAAPILLNLCLIGALLGLTPLLPSAGHALAWGTFLAGIAEFLYLVWDCRRAGMSLRLVVPRLSPEIRRFLKVFGPAALGAGIVQISLFADTLIASFLPTGSVSYLYYADRLNQLPLGVIGIAIGTVLLPELSRHLKRGDGPAASSSQNRAIELSLLLTLPAAAAFMVIAEPMLLTLFKRGAFDVADAHASAQALIAYGFGLPAFVLIRSLVPGFYARGDTATPVRVAAAAVAANIALKLALIGPFAHVGVALGTSISSWLNALLLAWLLRRRGLFQADARLRRALPRLSLATLGAAAAMAAGRHYVGPAVFLGVLTERVGALALLIGIGGGAFFLIALALGVRFNPRA